MNVAVIASENEPVLTLPQGWEALWVETKEHSVAEAWLAGMKTPAVRDSDQAAFLHADPAEHHPNWTVEMTANGGFNWIGPMLPSERDGGPDTAGLPIAGMCLRWTSRRLGVKQFEYGAGGQFVTTGETIRRISTKHYDWLRREAGRDRNAEVMERLWDRILAAE